MQAETTATRPDQLYSERQRRIFLFVLFLVSTSNYVDRNILAVLLEPIKAEFGASDTLLGLLTGAAFAVFYATLGIPVARWADRGNRRVIVTLALTVWSFMTVLCGMAQSFWMLALARIGVGAGEAGAIPPAQSLIADYFAPQRRGRALGVFMMSSVAGYVFGLIVGGRIAEAFGWRAAFVMVGVPGLLLAFLTHKLLHEPRELPRFAVASAAQESLRNTLVALMSKASYRWILVGLVMYFLMAYGAIVFNVSFAIRVHGFTLSEAGTYFGLIMVVGAVIGNIGGGLMTDRLVARHPSWHARIAGIGCLLAWPLYTAALIVPDRWSMLALFGAGAIMLSAVIPPMFSALHQVCGSRRRAMAVAIAFFFANLIGLSLGPLLTGALSDYFAQTRGTGEGLRYAMLCATTAFIPAGLSLVRAARTIPADIED